jgi:type II secretory pathway pseudopilin PulG
MGNRGQAGFTILETTLFLALTGLLVLMIVIGTGASLNTQRYRDAVESFKSLVQAQYTSLATVQNDRGSTFRCDSSAVVTQGPGGENRGQSNCILVGKYMRIDDDELSVYTVLAQRIGSANYSDIVSMQRNFAMNVMPGEIEEHTLDWGTKLAYAKSGIDEKPEPRSPRQIGILFVRSPDSGQVYTLTSDTVPAKDEVKQATFTAILSAANRDARMLCLNSGGLLSTGDSGIYLSAFAASANAAEVRTNQSDIAGSPKC